MKALAALLTALLMMLGQACAEEPDTHWFAEAYTDPQVFATVEADEGLTVLGSNGLLTISTYQDVYRELFVYAEVRNDSDRMMYLTGSTLLYDRDGAFIMEADNDEFYPRLLAPGQTAYLATGHSAWLRGDVEVERLGSMRLVIRDDPGEFFENTEMDVPAVTAYQRDCVSVSEAELPAWYDEAEGRRLTYVNETGMPLRNPSLAVGFYDAEGRLLYVLADQLGTGDLERPWYLPEGSAFAVNAVVEDVVAYCLQTLGVEEAEYHSVVFSRVGL